MPSAHLQELNDATFERTVTSTDAPVLVAFTSPTCPHCHKMAGTISSLADRSAGKAIVANVNVFAFPRLAAMAGVQKLPTFIFFHKGGEYARMIGDKNPPSAFVSALTSKMGR